MNKNLINFKKIILFFFLGLIYVNTIAPNKFPDNQILEKRFFEKNHEVEITPQKLILEKFIKLDNNYININQNLYKHYFFVNDGLLRNYFFAVNFLFCLFLVVCKLFLLRQKSKILETKSINIFITTISFPSVLLSISSISPESIYTIISIFVLVNFNCIRTLKGALFLILLLIYSFFLDRGNLYIFISFFVIYFNFLIIKKISEKFLEYKHTFIFIIILFLILFFYGKIIFIEVGSIINSEKVADLVKDLHDLNLNNINILELFYRICYFLITLLTLFFADFSFSILSIIFIFIFIIYFIINLRNKDFYRKFIFLINNRNIQIIFSSLLIFPIILINILPTHAYAKYYLFYIVFLIKPLQFLFGDIKVFKIIISYSLLSIAEIFVLNII